MPRKGERMPGPGDPDVILDVSFEDGLFFLSVENIGDQPAIDVVTKFARPLTGLNGEREISAVRLFRGITFLAPRKKIRIFLDTSASYFARRTSAMIDVTISFRNRAGETFTNRIRHDLRIYQDLGYTQKSPET